jgi:hypothetical protein
LKTVFPIAILILISVLLLPTVMGYTSTSLSSHPLQANPLTVWFNGAFQLTLAYPRAYEFNVAAKTAPGLWITSLHWDFGDGATRDVPFSAQSQVSDIEDHQYSSQANYCVTVTAYDSAGNVASVSQPLMTSYDFTLTATPATQNVVAGGSVGYSVAVGPWPMACGSGVRVSLAVSSPAPQGVMWTLTPSSGSTPFTSSLQVQTATTTPGGTYTITIVGTSLNVTHTTTVTFIVAVPVTVSSTSVSTTITTTVSQGFLEGFGIWWWIIIGVLGTILMIPFLLIFLYKPRALAAPVPVATVVPAAPIPPPPAPVPLPCPVCGNPMRPVELRWYCDMCQRYVWIHPE